MRPPAKTWQTIAKLSERLVELAEADSWDRVEQELLQRNQLIEQLLKQEIPPNQSMAIRQALFTIRRSDQRLNQLAEKQRSQALEGLREGGTGRKMQQAYAKAKRPY